MRTRIFYIKKKTIKKLLTKILKFKKKKIKIVTDENDDICILIKHKFYKEVIYKEDKRIEKLIKTLQINTINYHLAEFFKHDKKQFKLIIDQ
jgi:predicted PilT family ATPase